MIVLSIDQASIKCGASLWDHPKRRLLGSAPLEAPKGWPYSRRLQHLVGELNNFLKDKPRPQTVIFENVRPKLVMITVGAFLTSPYIDLTLNEQSSFISSSTWKKWAADRGAGGEFSKIKGVEALAATGFPVDQHGITSDDVCDSIMQYLAWSERS